MRRDSSRGRSTSNDQGVSSALSVGLRGAQRVSVSRRRSATSVLDQLPLGVLATADSLKALCEALCVSRRPEQVHGLLKGIEIVLGHQHRAAPVGDDLDGQAIVIDLLYQFLQLCRLFPIGSASTGFGADVVRPRI